MSYLTLFHTTYHQFISVAFYASVVFSHGTCKYAFLCPLLNCECLKGGGISNLTWYPHCTKHVFNPCWVSEWMDAWMNEQIFLRWRLHVGNWSKIDSDLKRDYRASLPKFESSLYHFSTLLDFSVPQYPHKLWGLDEGMCGKAVSMALAAEQSTIDVLVLCYHYGLGKYEWPNMNVRYANRFLSKDWQGVSGPVLRWSSLQWGNLDKLYKEIGNDNRKI